MSRLEHFRGHEDFIARLEDMLAACERQNRVIFTPFLSESEGRIVEQVCGKSRLQRSWGGYAHAQRRCYALLPVEMDIEFPVCVLKASYQPRFGRLTHRDVLGAFMHQGIDRAQLGDILIEENEIYVMALEPISAYLIDQVTMIRRSGLRFSRYAGVPDIAPRVQRRECNVSSLRLDAIVSAICRISRARAASLIEGGMVKVNDLPLEQCSALCDNNCAVSVRGHGRFQFVGVQKMTKKNRYVIEILVYC